MDLKSVSFQTNHSAYIMREREKLALMRRGKKNRSIEFEWCNDWCVALRPSKKLNSTRKLTWCVWESNRIQGIDWIFIDSSGPAEDTAVSKQIVLRSCSGLMQTHQVEQVNSQESRTSWVVSCARRMLNSTSYCFSFIGEVSNITWCVHMLMRIEHCLRMRMIAGKGCALGHNRMRQCRHT